MLYPDGLQTTAEDITTASILPGSQGRVSKDKPANDHASPAAEAGADTEHPHDEPASNRESNGPGSLSKSLTLRLYTSHFLSTWNSRLFEMGAVLFLASIFPDTLLQMSVYALVRSGSAILFSPTVGAWIDRGNRLNVVRVSIVGQRLAVAGSCGIFWVLQERVAKGRLESGLFALVIVLACVEKLCSVMNLVSVERDWVCDLLVCTIAICRCSLHTLGCRYHGR